MLENVNRDENMADQETFTLEGQLEEIISKAVEDHLPKPPKDSPRISGKTRGKAQPSSGGNAGVMADIQIGEFLQKIMSSLQPVLAAALNAAVTESTKHFIKVTETATSKIVAATTQLERKVTEVKSGLQKISWDMDKLEQYTRKENIKIYGIPVSENENTNRIAIELASQLGVKIADEDISVSHRLPPPRHHRSDGRQPPPAIIVRFTRRDKKTELMRKKKNLKGMKREGWNIYINDDLTQLRGTVCRALREEKNVKNVWSNNGKILCACNENGKEIIKSVDNLKDLVQKFGWPSERLAELGIAND